MRFVTPRKVVIGLSDTLDAPENPLDLVFPELEVAISARENTVVYQPILHVRMLLRVEIVSWTLTYMPRRARR